MRDILYKVSGGIFTSGLSVILNLLVPRSLGVANFGLFSFILTVSSQVLAVIDSKGSHNFYINISKDFTKSSIFYRYFKQYLFTFTLYLIVFIFFILIYDGAEIISLASIFIHTFLLWSLDIIYKIYDAGRLSKEAEILKAYQKFCLLIIIIYLFFHELISLNRYLFLLVFLDVIFLIYSYRKLLRKYPIFKPSFSRTSTVMTQISVNPSKQSFYMFAYTVCSISLELSDRFLIQHFGGSFQNGIYSFAYLFPSLFLIITSSTNTVVAREMSIFTKDNSYELFLKQLIYELKYIILLAVLASSFLFLHADILVDTIGSEEYLSSIHLVKIMAILPVVQLLSTIIGTIYFNLKIYKVITKISLFFLALSVFIYIVVLFWPAYVGFNSSNVAIFYASKFVIIETVAILFSAFFLFKYFDINIIPFILNIFKKYIVIIVVMILFKEYCVSFIHSLYGSFFAFLFALFFYLLIFSCYHLYQKKQV